MKRPCRIFESCRAFCGCFSVLPHLFRLGVSFAFTVHAGTDHPRGRYGEQNSAYGKIAADAGFGVRLVFPSPFYFSGGSRPSSENS
ncbi:MAG TPA: hypothetical protein DF364_06390 [Ruminococcaceae bacterium]|nr:hypothetical protein [Oscillospiraceae bacterium]HCU33454.1 hypothetical protein [Oscillospiraceae bacterium]